MRYVKTAALILALLLAGGCKGKEPNDLAYVVALGFDRADEENYLMTIQIARPTNVAGGDSESTGSEGEIVENIAVEAPNIYAGIGLANHIISKRLSLSHAKLIVFSQEVAESGISDIMETFSRNEELRPDVYMAVAVNSARQYLFDVKPVIEVNPERYYQLIYEQNSSSGVPENRAEDFYFNVKTGKRDNAIPLAGTKNEGEGGNGSSGKDSGGGSGEGGSGGSEKSGSGIGGNSDTQKPDETENKEQKNAPFSEQRFEFRLRDYIAGQVAVNESNASETIGMAIFKGDTAVKNVGFIETELYKMLTGNFKEAYMTLMCDKGDPVTVRAMQRRQPEYEIDMDKKEVNITMYFESDLYSLPSDYLAESGIAGFERAAREEITEAANKFIYETVKPTGADIFGLRGKFRSCFLTNGEYEPRRDEIMDYIINVNTDFRIRRTGLTVKEAGE